MGSARIRIETSGPLFRNWRIFVDDKDISHVVRGIKITADVENQRPEIELDLMGYAFFPDEIQARLSIKAHDEKELRAKFGKLYSHGEFSVVDFVKE